MSAIKALVCSLQAEDADGAEALSVREGSGVMCSRDVGGRVETLIPVAPGIANSH